MEKRTEVLSTLDKPSGHAKTNKLANEGGGLLDTYSLR